MIVEPTGSNPTVTGAIRQAAQLTGADFRYLLATAQVESKLNPNAQASASSAKGLFQFIDQTWLATLKEQGPALGYAPYSNAIGRTPTGEYAVTNPQMYRAVMNLRSDPSANALMAGAFTKANTGKLSVQLGRTPTEGELYIAHFLGAAGAGRLIGLAGTSPQTSAAPRFPIAAQANRSVFYDASGNARSVGEVYRSLVGRYEVARGQPPSMAASGRAPSAYASDTAMLTQTYVAASPPSPVPQARSSASVFHGLFRSAGENEPVAPVVNALWGMPAPSAARKPHPLPEPASESAAPAADNQSGPLDLFQDSAPSVGAMFRGRS